MNPRAFDSDDGDGTDGKAFGGNSDESGESGEEEAHIVDEAEESEEEEDGRGDDISDDPFADEEDDDRPMATPSSRRRRRPAAGKAGGDDQGAGPARRRARDHDGSGSRAAGRRRSSVASQPRRTPQKTMSTEELFDLIVASPAKMENHAEVFDAALAIRMYVQKALEEDFKVDNKPYDVFLREEKKRFEGQDMCDSLEVEPAIRQASAARGTLESFSEDTKKWKHSLTFSEQREAFEKLVESWGAALDELDGCRDCLKRCSEDSKAGKSQARKAWHENKAKISKWLESSGNNIPGNLAKVMGEVVYADAHDPAHVGIADTYRAPPEFGPAGEDDTRDSYFSGPKTVLAKEVGGQDGAAPSPSPWHAAVRSYFDTHKEAIAQRKETQEGKLKNAPDQAAIVGTVDTSSSISQLGGADDGAKKWFEDLTFTREVVVSTRCMFLDLTVRGNFLRGHSQWIKIWHGSVACFLVSPEQFEKNNDLQAWLAGCDLDDLKGNMAMILRAGSAIFVPTGWSMIYVGLPTDVDLRAAVPKLAPRGRQAQSKGPPKDPRLHEETVTVGFTPIYDDGSLAGVSNGTKVLLASSLALAEAALPQQLAADSTLSQWKQQLSS